MKRAFVAMMLVGAAVGCQLIVSSDVPDYTCGSTATGSCPSGLVCDVASGKCVQDTVIEAGDDDATPPTDGGKDAKTDGDANTGPFDVGADCTRDTECKDKLCVNSAVLTPTVVPNGSVCTKPCCTSAECGADFVCFSPGTGGSYCVSATRASRGKLGTKTPGTACTGNPECRSGVCADNKCQDTCCQQNDCEAGSTCRIATVQGHDSWVCGVPEGAFNVATTCSTPDQCKNNNCIGTVGVNRNCRANCCTAADCSAQGQNNYHCRYFDSSLDKVKSCQPNVAAPDAGAAGAGCTGDFDCVSDFCDPESRKCALPCCQDTDCAPTEKCRPSRTGTPFLRCVKADL